MHYREQLFSTYIGDATPLYILKIKLPIVIGIYHVYDTSESSDSCFNLE